MSKLLVVVGATGNQGGSIISWFQQHEPSWKIRGLTRNPSSDAAMALSKSGVEVVKADLLDLDSVKAAFKGANYIFAVTDFGGLMRDAVPKFKAGQISAPIGAEIARIETQHGRNMANAAAGVPQLERLVWSSEPNITRLSKGKYTQVFHFDAKAATTEYMLGLKALEGKVSALQMGVFVTNMFKIPDLWGFKMTEDKTAVYSRPIPGDLAIPWIDVEKDAGGFVKALIDAPAPTQVLGVSEWMSSMQWLELWSKQTGIPARFEYSAEIHTRADPSGLSQQFSETMKYIEDLGYTCGDPDVLMPEELEKGGFSVPRTKIADYMAREDWSTLIS